MLVIRMRRAGKKNKPFYRLVVSEQTRQPGSRVTDQVGYYDPKRTPEVLKVDIERVDAWIKKGATPSATVRHLIDRARSTTVQA